MKTDQHKSDSPLARAQRHVDSLIATNNLTVPPKLRSKLRPLDYIAYHKTLQDQFGNFRALVTDGCIVWCKLATDQITILHFTNIKPIPNKRSALKTSALKTKKPTKSQQAVLEWFKQFEQEEEE